MIFVTVGTHEQPFNRLVKCMDELVKNNRITESVIIQTGYATYEPKCCKWSKFFTYSEMEKNMDEARIVITHGGPSSFIMPIQRKKIPIVVPRRKEFEEHINNHQNEFCKAVAERLGMIIIVENIDSLGKIIQDYETIAAKMKIEISRNNTKFCVEFEKIVNDII